MFKVTRTFAACPHRASNDRKCCDYASLASLVPPSPEPWTVPTETILESFLDSTLLGEPTSLSLAASYLGHQLAFFRDGGGAGLGRTPPGTSAAMSAFSNGHGLPVWPWQVWRPCLWRWRVVWTMRARPYCWVSLARRRAVRFRMEFWTISNIMGWCGRFVWKIEGTQSELYTSLAWRLTCIIRWMVQKLGY